jgi:hypothetical protein
VSWRGQGRRARGRRGDQKPEADNTAWLAELERAAVEQDDEEDEWASKLRRRRSQDPAPPRPRPAEPQDRASEPPRSSPASGLPGAPVTHDLSPYPPLGGEPVEPPPPAGPRPAREPDYRMLGMEPDVRDPAGDWDTGGWSPEPPPRPSGGWTPEPPAPSAGGWAAEPPSHPAGGWDPGPAPRSPGSAGEPAPDWPRWDLEAEARGDAPADFGRGYDEPRGSAPVDHGEVPGGPWNGASADHDLGERDWRPAGPDTPTGAWSPEPTGREPDYPALFGELNRRSAAQREPLWDSPPAPEPYEEPGAFDPAPAWPFEETTQTWEPSDRSFVWPAEEQQPGATTSDWEPSTSAWLDEPATPPPAAPPPTWPAASTGTATPGAPPPAPPEDWAAGIHSGVPPSAHGTGGWEGDPAAPTWRPDGVVEAEPAVPLDADGLPPAGRASERFEMAEPADSWELDDRPHRAWPKVLAIVSWVVLLMVVCWFYVFPWLEGVLPENF